MYYHHMIKILHVAVTGLLSGHLRACIVMWITRDGLDITKLVHQVFQQILDPIRFIFESSRVKTDSLE